MLWPKWRIFLSLGYTVYYHLEQFHALVSMYALGQKANLIVSRLLIYYILVVVTFTSFERFFNNCRIYAILWVPTQFGHTHNQPGCRQSLHEWVSLVQNAKFPQFVLISKRLVVRITIIKYDPRLTRPWKLCNQMLCQTRSETQMQAPRSRGSSPCLALRTEPLSPTLELEDSVIGCRQWFWCMEYIRGVRLHLSIYLPRYVFRLWWLAST